MYKIQVWYDRHWKDGLHVYGTIDAAQRRLEQLTNVGIKARLKPVTED